MRRRRAFFSRSAAYLAVLLIALVAGTSKPAPTVAAPAPPPVTSAAALDPGLGGAADSWGSPPPPAEAAALADPAAPSLGSSFTRSQALPLLGAYYYSWYPGNLSGGLLGSALIPPAGPSGSYDSADPAVAAQAISQASSAGVDFFALDWWPGAKALDAAIDTGFLSAPNLNRTHFAILYETQGLSPVLATSSATPMTPPTTAELVANMVSIATSYFANPRYLRINGRPVLFWYLTRTMTGDVAGALSAVRSALGRLGYDPFIVGDEIFREVLTVGGVPTTTVQVDRARLFDALTWYSLYEPDPTQAGYGVSSTFLSGAQQLVQTYKAAVHNSVPIVASVTPGFNDRVTRPADDHPAIPRQWAPGAPTGSFLEHMFTDLALPAVDPRAPMVMITSWNEFNEQTAIAPVSATVATTVDQSPTGSFYTQGYQYGGTGTEALDVVRQVASRRGAVPETSSPFNPG